MFRPICDRKCQTEKNSSKCSNLICCRGQDQRPFPSDSLAVRRILVLLVASNEHRQLGLCIVNGRTAQQQPFLQNVRHLSTCWRVLLSWQCTKRFLSLYTCGRYVEPRHAVQIIGNICASRNANHRNLGGRGRAKFALLLFKRLRFWEMRGTSNGSKIRNKISATFRHLNLPFQNAGKVVTPRREL